MTRPRCPICKKYVDVYPSNSWFPFCSKRCKLVDLGNWLDDRYGVTSEAPFDQGDDLTSKKDDRES